VHALIAWVSGLVALILDWARTPIPFLRQLTVGTAVGAVIGTIVFVVLVRALRTAIGDLTEERQGIWLSRTTGSLLGVQFAVPSMVPALAEAYGIILVGRPEAVHSLAGWSAGGSFVGLLGGILVERMRLQRTVTAVSGFGAALLGAVVLTVGTSPLAVELGAAIAGIGAGALIPVLQAKTVWRVTERKLVTEGQVNGTILKFLLLALAASLVISSTTAGYELPRLTAAFMAVVALGGGWVLWFLVRQPEKELPVARPLRAVLVDWALMRRILSTCVVYGSMTVLDVLSFRLFVHHGWPPFLIGLALSLTVLPGALWMGWWTERVGRKGLDWGERFATGATLGGVLLGMVALLAAASYGAWSLFGVLIVTETFTAWAYYVGNTDAIGSGGEVTPTTLLQLGRGGATRWIFTGLILWLVPAGEIQADVAKAELSAMGVAWLCAAAASVVAWLPVIRRFGSWRDWRFLPSR
jgi:hypothetical protein